MIPMRGQKDLFSYKKYQKNKKNMFKVCLNGYKIYIKTF